MVGIQECSVLGLVVLHCGLHLFSLCIGWVVCGWMWVCWFVLGVGFVKGVVYFVGLCFLMVILMCGLGLTPFGSRPGEFLVIDIIIIIMCAASKQASKQAS